MSEVLYIQQTFTDCLSNRYIYFDMLCHLSFDYYIIDLKYISIELENKELEIETKLAVQNSQKTGIKSRCIP